MLYIVSTGLVMSSLSGFLAAYMDKRFEESLPMTMFLAVIVGYVFGLFGMLGYAAPFICIMSLMLWIAALVTVRKRNNYKQFVSNMITPASVFFVIVMGAFAYFTVGSWVAQWDEYTHWATSVKIMFQNNRLYSDPALGARFASYTPGIGIFEYIFMKIRGEWADWALYYAYAFFGFGLVLPFFRKARFRDMPRITVHFLVLVGGMKMLINDSFTDLQVDSILALLFAFSMVYIVCFDVFESKYDNFMLTLAVAVLILLKDAAALFAATIIVIYIYIYRNTSKKEYIFYFVSAYSTCCRDTGKIILDC